LTCSAFIQFAADNIDTEFNDEVNIMSWEYKRVILTGVVKTDSIEERFNTLGKDRWELTTAVIIDGIQNSMYHKDDCTIEYVFKRKL
jgi:hypothetical protein